MANHTTTYIRTGSWSVFHAALITVQSTPRMHLSAPYTSDAALLSNLSLCDRGSLHRMSTVLHYNNLAFKFGGWQLCINTCATS
eukprot:2734816-Amphidinium_carterae.2